MDGVPLEIFDETFVAENVYSGQAVEPEHRLNLHRFAVGDQAVIVARQLDELSKEITAKNTELRQLREAIQRYIDGDMNVDEFVNLQPVEQVDQQIASLQQLLESLRGIQQVLNASSFRRIVLPTLDLNELSVTLATTLTGISAEAEREVKEHIRRCMDHRGESWIAQGMDYIRENCCPFCGQDLEGVSLIEAYKAYFATAYSNFKRQVAAAGETVGNVLAEPQLSGLRSTVLENERISHFWRQHVKVDLPQFDSEWATRILADLREYVQDLIRRKSQAPVEVVTLGSDEMSPLKEYRALVDQVRLYNEAVDRANEAILEKRRELRATSSTDVEHRLNLLRNARTRFSQDVRELCEAYNKLLEEKNELEHDKNKTRQMLEELSARLLRDYGDAINRVLARFGASFRLAEVRETHYGGTARLDYELDINGYRVGLEDTGRRSPRPCFRSTLSSGDRTALAFAFFLARMDGDPSVADRIIVLDDPLSSLDDGRQTQTVQEVVRIAERCRQLVLLSHDRYFLAQVWKAARRRSCDVRALRLPRHGDGTTIAPWDIASESQRPPLREFFVLKDYLDGEEGVDLNSVASCIRPLLENSLRFRFPDEFTMDDTLGEMIRKIRNAREPSPLVRLQPRIGELEDIDAYACRFHHGSAGMNVQTTDAELRSFATRALEFHRAVDIAE
ncbi:AAA family ATPase [Carboxydochorda subterranea]|uniref:AAA family ATPase n=1 Tax=Carboxydichorda subterranea TaxID=3109565 RepID=A0ABZ1C153_9FIRM|nr:AAA family ATPase [Limnochorda sp. L945t]WRP18807.1 AAA family ATPase [Limnochorda sp. L945t]